MALIVHSACFFTAGCFLQLVCSSKKHTFSPRTCHISRHMWICVSESTPGLDFGPYCYICLSRARQLKCLSRYFICDGRVIKSLSPCHLNTLVYLWKRAVCNQNLRKMPSDNQQNPTNGNANKSHRRPRQDENGYTAEEIVSIHLGKSGPRLAINLKFSYAVLLVAHRCSFTMCYNPSMFVAGLLGTGDYADL